MLILAGVSINAIVGENGILTRTQYATFLNEMAAVEEAVGMWKAGDAIDNQGETTAIPTNGMCQTNTLDEVERLKGEVGYYRSWSANETMPAENILMSADDFNSTFGPELISFPAGVQDLYYLNNEACGIDSKKTYLIDAATGMVYSMTGINLKGVSCYSSSMAKAVMTGNMIAPQFAIAEVSGSGSDEKLAGNVQSEFLEDGTPNPDYNPNGFRIIASTNSNNIFKLYNNGDLYGKGIKGIQLNTSPEEMEKINAKKWIEFKVPDIIPGASTNNIQIFPGYGTIYVIDNEGYLWAWGNNSNNKLGLNQEEQKEYTGRDPVKLNIDGKKIKIVYTGNTHITFAITQTNEVYACGYNVNGNLGLGYKSQEVNEFTKVNVNNVDQIKKIIITGYGYGTFIWYNDNTFFYVGKNGNGILSTGNNTEEFLNWTQVYDNIFESDTDENIQDMIAWSTSIMILTNKNRIYQVGYRGADAGGGGGDLTGSNYQYQPFPTTFGTNVTGIYQVGNGRLIIRTNDNDEMEVWGTPGKANNLGLGSETYNSNKYWKIEIPAELKNDGIKEIFSTSDNVYYLSNSGKVYVSGNASTAGLNLSSGKVDGIVYSGLDNIKTLYSTDIVKYNNFSSVCTAPICFTGKDGKIYTVGNQSIVFGNNILQSDWKKVASNVKYFDARGSAYIDRDNNLWIAGADSMLLGLGEMSETSMSINNYVLNMDSNIQGKAKEVICNEGGTYVLTTDNKLWATGLYSSNGTTYYMGWKEQENKSTFVPIEYDDGDTSTEDIIQNISFFTTVKSNSQKIIITNDGKAYGWGLSYSGANGISGTTKYETSHLYTLPTEIGGVGNVKALKATGWQRTHLVTQNGNWFVTGAWSNGAYDGGYTPKQKFSEYTHSNLVLNANESVKDVIPMNDANVLMLTSNGRLFGYGAEKYLGINSTSAENTEIRELLVKLEADDEIEQVVAGNGWYVLVTKDGRVYGTGTNTYGILGRWVGSPRGYRYRTAFEWVECPDLEI